MVIKLRFAILAAVLACAACRADTVCLADGTEIDGTVVEDNANTVVIQRPNGATQSFRKADVDAVVYAKKAAPAAKPAPEPAPVAKKPEPVPKKEEPAAKKAEPAKPVAGETKTPDNATKPAQAVAKEGESKPKAAENTAVKEGAAPPKDAAATKDAAPAKPAADAAKTPEGQSKETVATKDEKGKEKEPWSPPPGLLGFPNLAKRMPKEKEEAFMAALARLDTMDEGSRQAAEGEISALGGGVMPYLIAGSYHAAIPARTSCMRLIGKLNGRNAVKHVIEIFYAVLPADGEPATFQGPFLEAIRSTLPTISGQDFFTADPRRPIVQEFIKRYITWYNDNFDRLAPQLGDPDLEPTDPDYMKKMKEARALKLEKRSWPRPPLSADMVDGGKTGTSRAKPTADQMVRPEDRSKTALPTVGRDDVGKRR